MVLHLSCILSSIGMHFRGIASYLGIHNTSITRHHCSPRASTIIYYSSDPFFPLHLLSNLFHLVTINKLSECEVCFLVLFSLFICLFFFTLNIWMKWKIFIFIHLTYYIWPQPHKVQSFYNKDFIFLSLLSRIPLTKYVHHFFCPSVSHQWQLILLL